jgi:ABC-type multidrug transport system fused ATPase/permease subunit
VKKGLSDIAYSLKVSFVASPRWFLLKCAMLIFSTLMPLIVASLWKDIINLVSNSGVTTVSKVIAPLITYCLFIILQNAQDMINEVVKLNYNDSIETYVDELVMSKSADVDMAFFDTPSMRDGFNIAVNAYSVLPDITWTMFDMISDVFSIIASFVIISSFNIWAGIIIAVLLIPSFIYGKEYEKKSVKMTQELVRERRRLSWYSGIILDISAIFEIKLNNIGLHFIERYKEIFLAIKKRTLSFESRAGIVKSIISCLDVVADILVLLLSIKQTIAGAVGIGILQYNLNVASLFRFNLTAFLQNLKTVVNYRMMVNQIHEFDERHDESSLHSSGSLRIADISTIEFRDVDFSYPNSDQRALVNCSFSLNAGEKIVLIGQNGSGKSTILKLLFRFYDVDKGAIYINGTNIKDYDLNSLRSKFKTVFQEVVPFALPLRESIALSDLDYVNDIVRLNDSVTKSGLSDVVAEFSDGFDTLLGKYYHDSGIELSGGQWQLLAIARAHFRRGNVFILDEPTAHLDPFAESKLFKQLYALGTDKTMIAISHRLYSGISADKIILLRGGTVLEMGTHRELITLDGEYAKLFNMQRQRYLS